MPGPSVGPDLRLVTETTNGSDTAVMGGERNGHEIAETEARIREVLDALIHERQELRRTGAESPALEANRLAIVYWLCTGPYRDRFVGAAPVRDRKSVV